MRVLRAGRGFVRPAKQEPFSQVNRGPKNQGRSRLMLARRGGILGAWPAIRSMRDPKPDFYIGDLTWTGSLIWYSI
jgi:hypothetical protein